MAEDYNGTPVPDSQNPGPSDEGQNENIPDWMKEAGWETSSGTFDESKPVFDDLDDEDEIVPADIPAWLEEAAPEGFSTDPNATPAFEGLDVDEPFITTGDLVPPPSMDPTTEETDDDQPTVDEQPRKAEEPTAEESFDIPSWLDNLEIDEDSQETAVAWLENMPESLRATEDELEAARQFPTEEPDVIEDPVDELAWIEDMDLASDQPDASTIEEQAALSEDLVASELLPEESDPDQIFEPEEIESIESDLPSWLQELGDDQPASTTAEDSVAEEPVEPSQLVEDEAPPEMEQDQLPDWLRTRDEPEELETSEATASDPLASEIGEVTDIPEWLDGFDDNIPDEPGDEESREWLGNLQTDEGTSPSSVSTPQIEDSPEETIIEAPDDPEAEISLPEPGTAAEDFDGVSPEDETLNTQIPDWLTNISDSEEVEEEEPPKIEEPRSADTDGPMYQEDDFQITDSWLDQIGDAPADTPQEVETGQEPEESDWLDVVQSADEDTLIEELIEDLEAGPPDQTVETPSPELESAQFLTETEHDSDDAAGDLPDWLAELREEEDDQSLSLEEAIRKSDHDLNQDEVDFLSQVEEKQEEEADWLSKLDQVDSQLDFEPPASPEDLEPGFEEEPSGDQSPDPVATSGMLERLKGPDAAESDGDVPQWLSDLKEEEDPQETAVLWLQQFVNQGDRIDIKDEIKRYTDELDPGDSIPKWMEDLKNEEDPQTTAMLWLERLAGQKAEATPAPPAEEEDKGWLADLEREAAERPSEDQIDRVKEFDDPDQGWLADLESDENTQTTGEEEVPDWSTSEEETPEGEPSWMKATSPLEGDFFTDELKGGEEKDVEVPEWLAGYAEGETPQESSDQESDDEEYTWLSATDSPGVPKSLLDLNIAAISQLESILGISHQIAKGIVSYREKNGPFKDVSELKNVPEITDEQTIEILKPEVFVSDADDTPSEEPTPPPQPTAELIPSQPSPPQSTPARKPAKSDNFEEMLVTARARTSEGSISEAIDLYTKLIKKKKFLEEIIEDLQKASQDHPLEISIQKTLGDAFMGKNKLDEALEAYSKAEDLLA